MALEPISPELVRIALARVEGFQFERFVNDFYPAISGRGFVPLGGVKDKGADAYLATVYEDQRKATTFFQTSVGAEVEEKIRKTVNRLREVRRDPRSLTYVTSRSVKYSDTVEQSLSEELDVAVRIRDAGYIVSHINDGDQTKAAFHHHLRYLTDYLKSVGASTLLGSSRHVQDPTVYVFLAQELERRGGDQSLVASMIDSLILWALEDTDPDQGKFLSEAEVTERILQSCRRWNTSSDPGSASGLPSLRRKPTRPVARCAGTRRMTSSVSRTRLDSSSRRRTAPTRT